MIIASSEADNYRDANFAKSLGTLPVTLFVGALGCSSKETEPASSEADSYRAANFAKSLGTLTVTLCVGASCCSSKETRRTVVRIP